MSADQNTVVPVNGLNDCIAQPPKDDAAAAHSEQPSLNGVDHTSSPSNVEGVVSSVNGDHVSVVASSIAPSSKDETDFIAGPSSSCDDEVPELVETKKVVGYDRGLEADHIVGATEKDGKLMFLIAWKNSVDGKADLLEATEVYEKSPQVAIQFFQERLKHIPPAERRFF